MEAIQERSPNSAGGPIGIPTSLLINCTEEIAPVFKILFSHSLSSSLIPTSFSSQVINSYLVIVTSVLSKVIEKEKKSSHSLVI